MNKRNRRNELIFIIIAAFFVLFSAMVDVRISFWLAFVLLIALAVFTNRQTNQKHLHR